jgi:hypothetical protein
LLILTGSLLKGMICKAQIEGARLEELSKNRKAMIVMRLAEKLSRCLTGGFGACWLEILIQRAGGGLQNQLTVCTIMQVIFDIV